MNWKRAFKVTSEQGTYEVSWSVRGMGIPGYDGKTTVSAASPEDAEEKVRRTIWKRDFPDFKLGNPVNVTSVRKIQ